MQRVLVLVLVLAWSGCTKVVCFAGGREETDRFNVSVEGELLLPPGADLLAIFADNQNATFGNPVLDRDGDGLSDEYESRSGLDPGNPFTLGDGYSDAVRVGYGRPEGGELPPCLDLSDEDHDGLGACEEMALGTDPAQLDSDGDLMPDGVELRAGSQPAVADANLDADFDGEGTRSAVFRHRAPVFSAAQWGYRYRLVDGVAQSFNLVVSHINVVSGPDAEWENRILFWRALRLTDGAVAWETACQLVMVRVDGAPVRGFVLEAEAWKPAAQWTQDDCQPSM